MSAVAGGQPTGHFHIQFVESGQPHPEAWAEGGGEPPDPCRQTVGGGLSCSFLPVPLEGGEPYMQTPVQSCRGAKKLEHVL